MEASCSRTLAIALGANLGIPAVTLVAVRPLLSEAIDAWVAHGERPAEVARPLWRHWSPLFMTVPVGGPPGQPPYLNAVLLVERDAAGPDLHPWPSPDALLGRLLALERRFGRERRERWGPRSLDLDLLWCGDHLCRSPELVLPHPRLGERTFVLAPLAAIDPHQPLPGEDVSVAERLADLLARPGEIPPERLSGRTGWPEGP
ncbi:2-amino-4-hydroxy-6-hydroxymethyldihydropteridine pyrophosphokinase [Cyanobium gracile PCC 6307]|uniref:2-amino-4-hydroxy-6-hydroxymethyldihydropteridine diphosphokinase n=2 Tax=Cyanobium gracile TaxID=59930 RepID=K9P762_CYAGP|nr:2-amino-4-hydroxy-6-hydroxymethyldihydropteridine pyrophosphokinase [Cyanobium gracile PCC 6307]